MISFNLLIITYLFLIQNTDNIENIDNESRYIEMVCQFFTHPLAPKRRLPASEPGTRRFRGSQQDPTK